MYSLRSPLFTGGGRPLNHTAATMLLGVAIGTSAMYMAAKRSAKRVSSQIKSTDSFPRAILVALMVAVLTSGTYGVVPQTGSATTDQVVEEAQELFVSEQGEPLVVASAFKATVTPPEKAAEKESANVVQARYQLAAQQNAVVTQRMRVPMTAYSSTVDQTDSTPFITASGTHVHWGTVAANFLPFGTKVRIPEMYGDQIFIVEDRMNKRYDYKLDIWMPTRQQALQFGRRTLLIEIVQ